MSASGQPAKKASVALDVVTSFGAPLPGGEVHIDGQGVHEVITIKNRTTVILPYGTYRLTSEPSAYYWASERTVDIIVPKAFVLIALARKETFAVSGEGTPTPYTVSGTVALGRTGNSKLFARLRGLYVPSSAEAEIDEHGHFELAVRLQGSYSVEILDGELIAAAKTILCLPKTTVSSSDFQIIVVVVLYWRRVMLTTTLDLRELEFLIRQIDEYIQVMEFMIRKTPALDMEKSRWPGNSGRS